MRKLLIMACTMALFAIPVSTVSAQSENPWFGFRAGAVISTQDFKDGNLDQDIKSKFGLDLALVFDFPIGDVVSLGPEVHWVQKGAKFTDPIGETTTNLDYLEIPLLVRVHFGRPSGLQLFAGPSVSYLLSGRDKDGDGNTTDIDLDFYKRADFGGVVGAGIAFGPLLVDARYIVGFGNIVDSDLENLDVKNRSFGAGLTLMF